MDESEEAEKLQVWSWGACSDGQLGTGSCDDSHIPQIISFPPSCCRQTISRIACGGAHSIALTVDGRVLSWGRGSSGQLGHGDLKNCLTPKPVEFFKDAVICYVSAGWNHSGFISGSGLVFTCGDGSFGQLGHGDYESHSSPAEILFFASKHVLKITCGMRHSLALLKGAPGSRDLLYGFGSAKRGQLGSSTGNSIKSIAIPKAIHGFANDDIITISANGDHSVILCANGLLYIWGRGFSGTSDVCLPQLLPSALKFSQVALGWNHALLLTDYGEVFMLGGMLGGQQESLEKVSFYHATSEGICSALIPTRVAGLDGIKVVQIEAGAEHSALVTENGDLMTWGWGEHGQLGLGDNGNHTIPQKVSLASTQLNGNAGLRVYCGSGFTIAVARTSLHAPN